MHQDALVNGAQRSRIALVGQPGRRGAAGEVGALGATAGAIQRTRQDGELCCVYASCLAA